MFFTLFVSWNNRIRLKGGTIESSFSFIIDFNFIGMLNNIVVV